MTWSGADFVDHALIREHALVRSTVTIGADFDLLHVLTIVEIAHGEREKQDLLHGLTNCWICVNTIDSQSHFVIQHVVARNHEVVTTCEKDERVER